MAMINVVIADDHAVVRRGLMQIITETPDIAVTAEASNGDELLREIRRHPCDVVVSWYRQFTKRTSSFKREMLLHEMTRPIDRETVRIEKRDVKREFEFLGEARVPGHLTSDLWVWEAADGRDYAVIGSWGGPGNAYFYVVMDLNMPGRSGLETLKHLHAESPKLPVLILSMHDEDQYAVRVLRAGASGYLTKESAAERLVEAIRRVAKGGKFMSPAVAESLLSRLDTGAEGPPHEALSDREFQVLRLLASGKTATEISEMLSLSVKTISTYRARVLEKMNMKSNAELTHYAIKNNLIY